MKRLQRGAGVVLPVSALPGPYGIGDFSGALAWLRWLRTAGMRYWQILPLTIPDSVGSPFASPSAEAMNPMLVSPDWLLENGLLQRHDLRSAKHRGVRIDGGHAYHTKNHLLRLAWENWLRRDDPKSAREFAAWRRTQSWLPAYSAYQAIKDSYHGQPWSTWAPKWRDGRQAIDRLTPALTAAAEWHSWCQWTLAQQWQRVRAEAKRNKVIIIGDLPFYVQYDSVDVWQRPELFLLDAHRKMRVVSGSWPDLFSHQGQKWGTPVYRWSVHRRDAWRWWTNRIAAGMRLYDLMRFDHFPGLQATWHVPINAVDGTIGRWSKTPGHELLSAIARRIGHLPFIAEDLGRMSTSIIKLRHQFHVPGSRVLQFAWSGLPDNLHEPRLVTADMVYYTANHDTDTTLGWLAREAKWYEKKHLRDQFGSLSKLPWKFITTVMEHRAVIAMLHIADILELGHEARINHPGTQRRNWSWRLGRWPSRQRAGRLRRLALKTRRVRSVR